MSIATEIAAAIQRVRPHTTQGHADRIARTVEAVIRSELRWLDVYEGRPTRGYEQER